MRASVIVPAFNAAQTIEPCLRALLAQSCPRDSYEIIVADDGSTDATAQLAEALPGVRVLRSPHAGAAAARNRGARAARGEVLLFTDADCEPLENWVHALLAPFEEAEAQIAGAKGVYRTRQSSRVARWVQLEYEEKYARMSRARYIDFIDTYSAAYRRDIFLANGGFDESFPGASVEDQEFSFRLARQGYRMVFVPQAAVLHQHVTTLREYAARKFRIGYWKVRVHRRHPGKAWRDSHTPLSEKAQVALVGPTLLSLAAIPFAPYAGLACAALTFAFAASAVPLVRQIARRDRAVAALAPAMLAVRAGALAAGLAAGTWGELLRSGAVKRAFDVIGASLGLILCAPLMALIALAIKLDSPGPVLFKQLRAGKDGRPFTIWKFRSMVRDAEQQLEQVVARSALPPPVFKIPNDPRVTRVGRVLRRFSLDELPQFVNVLKGEMSLVGPRPEELRIVALYDERHRQRLSVKPGMTGPMQVNGRANLSLDQRVEVELDYIERENLLHDLHIMLLTLPAVMSGRGAY